MAERNRAEGWQHAKLSGHTNESAIELLLKSSPAYQKDFLFRIGRQEAVISRVDTGGLHEKNVAGILGESTKAKPDIRILLDDGSRYNVSIKKSIGGQAYLIDPFRFMDGFEKHYGKRIPEDVERAIRLFWGAESDVKRIISLYGTHKLYENRKHRLTAETLYAYDPHLCEVLLRWFAENMYEVTDFCFSRGLAKNPADWADLVWYKNEVGENNLNHIFDVHRLCDAMQEAASPSTVFYGSRSGGTTIQLPFGFVQWHSPTKAIPGCMQFHHSLKKIRKALLL
ncbi:MAG: hypothetical protein J1E61_10715 [Lachnospiraceae bacterium]|nr:hypothetical protein [Lachnospiraceae bacterium]